MRIGYARVSAKDQNLSLQLDALRQEGCQTIYQEKVSGAKAERPELRRMIEQLREGDLIVIWKLDRLGRSLRDLVNLVTEIQDKGAGLKSLNDSIDTTTPHGKLTFHLFAALAEFERDIIRERTMAGLAAVRDLRPSNRSFSFPISDFQKRVWAITEICRYLGICRTTLYKYLRFRGVGVGK